MKLEHLGAEAQVAAELVREVMSLQGLGQEGIVNPSFKRDGSPVTVVDLAVQALIAAGLSRRYPGDAVVAEEDATALRENDRVFVRRVLALVRRIIPEASTDQVLEWVDLGSAPAGSRFWALDPVDGTQGLLHGRQYAIALALVVEGVVRVGVIGCPRLALNVDVARRARCGPTAGGLAVGVRGGGAWWSPAADGCLLRLSVSDRADVTIARVLRSHEARHGDAERFARVRVALGLQAPTVLMDSQAKHVALAAGDADLLIRLPPSSSFREAIWDQAAGSLLIQEAGGRVTDLAGGSLDFGMGRRLAPDAGVLASNGALHDAAVHAIRIS